MQAIPAALTMALHALMQQAIPQVAGLPPLYESGVEYEAEPWGSESWLTPREVLARRAGDCEDLAAWRAAELRVAGVDPAARPVLIHTGPNSYHAVVRLADGTLEDPSAVLGMPTDPGMAMAPWEPGTAALYGPHVGGPSRPGKPSAAEAAAEAEADRKRRLAAHMAFQRTAGGGVIRRSEPMGKPALIKLPDPPDGYGWVGSGPWMLQPVQTAPTPGSSLSGWTWQPPGPLLEWYLSGSMEPSPYEVSVDPGSPDIMRLGEGLKMPGAPDGGTYQPVPYPHVTHEAALAALSDFTANNPTTPIPKTLLAAAQAKTGPGYLRHKQKVAALKAGKTAAEVVEQANKAAAADKAKADQAKAAKLAAAEKKAQQGGAAPMPGGMLILPKIDSAAVTFATTKIPGGTAGVIRLDPQLFAVLGAQLRAGQRTVDIAAMSAAATEDQAKLAAVAKAMDAEEAAILMADEGEAEPAPPAPGTAQKIKKGYQKAKEGYQKVKEGAAKADKAAGQLAEGDVEGAFDTVFGL